MKKVNKGDYGYIRYEKKKRLLITVALFLIPLAAFLAAFLITGTKKKHVLTLALPDDYIEHGSVDVLRKMYPINGVSSQPISISDRQ